MAGKFRKTKNGSFSMDLSKIDGFAYRLQKNKSEILTKLQDIADSWGSGTKTEYAGKIRYAMGLHHPAFRNKQAFYEVEKSGTNALTVSVGHRAWAVKFVEVGTKAHSIPHKTRNGKMTTANVRGVAGSHALGKAFDNRRRELVREIEKTVSDLITRS